MHLQGERLQKREPLTETETTDLESGRRSGRVIVALAQYAPLWENRGGTRGKIADLVAAAPRQAWLVFPEMALSGFTMNVEAATWDEEDYAFFSRLAADRRSWITVGAVEQGQNVALIYGPDGSVAARYAKRHLFSFSGEDRHYRAGDKDTLYRIADLGVEQGICYDLRFPHRFWAHAPELEAYCFIAAWGAKRAEHWRVLLRARAIENQAFVIGVNRIGAEPGVEYAGGSAVVDPEGKIRLECGEEEGLFSTEIDRAEVLRWRREFSALGDRSE